MNKLLDPEEIKNKCRKLSNTLSKLVSARVVIGLEKRLGKQFSVTSMVGYTPQEFAFTICIEKERYDTPIFPNPYLYGKVEHQKLIDWIAEFSNQIIDKHSHFVETGKRLDENKDDTGKERDRSTEWDF